MGDSQSLIHGHPRDRVLAGAAASNISSKSPTTTLFEDLLLIANLPRNGNTHALFSYVHLPQCPSISAASFRISESAIAYTSQKANPASNLRDLRVRGSTVVRE